MKYLLVFIGFFCSLTSFAQVGFSVSIDPTEEILSDIRESTIKQTQLVEGYFDGITIRYKDHISMDLSDLKGEKVYVTAYTKTNHADITISIDGVPVVNNYNSIRGYLLGFKNDLIGKSIEVYSRNSKLYTSANRISDLLIEMGSNPKVKQFKVGYRMMNENLINKFKIKIELK